jgi:AIPR protein
MTGNEVVLIDSFIADAQKARDTALPDDVAFELFAAGTVLRDRNLSDEEIEAGRIGGGMDGGLDAVYVFQDGALLDEDSDVFSDEFTAKNVRKSVELDLWLIQAKRETSFTETAFDKVESSLGRLLDLTQTDNQLAVYYSPELIARMRLFTRSWTILLARSPVIRVHFDYVTRGNIESASAPVEAKRADLEAHLCQKISNSKAEARLIGAKDLWALASATPEYDLQLTFEDYVSKGDSYSGIVSLADYYSFLTDSHGALQAHLFDWNVRDYQGEVAVNREIKASLEDGPSDDFWWLNNGVTILCSEINIGGNKTFTLGGVQIVNGMQTSYSIHSVIGRIGIEEERKRNRSILVRVIKTHDEATRDRIIRATNSQTKVPDASLHATEDIHRQLESHFLAHDWYYDRRKNFYKNNGKPADRIVAISALGQAVMAIGLGRPDDARARPSSLLSKSTDYKQIFSPKLPLDTYLWIISVQRRVDVLLRSQEVGANRYEQTNLRFHVSMFLVTKVFGGRIYNPSQLTQLAQNPLEISAEDAKSALEVLVEKAGEFGLEEGWPLDRVAKSKAFVELAAEFALEE